MIYDFFKNYNTFSKKEKEDVNKKLMELYNTLLEDERNAFAELRRKNVKNVKQTKEYVKYQESIQRLGLFQEIFCDIFENYDLFDVFSFNEV